jgi:MFS family permease
MTATLAPRFAFRSTFYAWAVVGVLCLGSVVSMLERQVINLLVEPIKADLHISDTQVSLLQGFAFAIFYAAMALPIGRIIDARSRVAVIAWGALVFSCATFSCGLATSFLALAAARTLVGAGEATLTPAGMSLLGDYLPPDRLGRAMGLFVGATYAGSGIALIAIGQVLAALAKAPQPDLPLIGPVKDWQLAFMIAALPGFLYAAFFVLTVREPPRSAPAGATVGEPVALAEVRRFASGEWRLLLPLFLGVPLLAAANFAMNAWVPTFFIRTYGWDAARTGPVFGLLVVVCGTGGTVAGGALADWLAKRGARFPGLVVPVLSALAAVPFVPAYALAGDAGRSLWLLAPAMFLGAMPFGAGSAGIIQIAPNRMRGQLAAIYMLLATIVGTGGGPWMLATWTDAVVGSPALIRYSLAVVPTALFIAGAGVIAIGLALQRRSG